MITNSLYQEYLKKLGDIPNFLVKYLNIKSLERLKEISYFCGMDYASKSIYNFSEYISRYDHSLTVALLTWKFTKNKKMTLASLFHDISTPCFSHVIDYMNGDYCIQESTESYTGEILKNDLELKKCLEIDNILLEDIIDFKKYSLVDNKRPKLCADRIDGIILTSISWTKNINIDEIFMLIDNLKVYVNENNELEFGFKNKNSGFLAIKLNKIIDEYCHSSEDNYMMCLLANITKLMIDNGFVSYNDLYYLREDELINKIENCNCKEILSLFNKFKNIKKSDIPEKINNMIKNRSLKPIIRGRRDYNA